MYLEHRLVFLYEYGLFPTDTVDHVNRVPYDNRRVNLRLATSSENNAHRGLQKNNTSGHCGVYWVKSRGKWQATGRDRRGKHRHLGFFAELSAAACAAREWRLARYGEFAA